MISRKFIVTLLGMLSLFAAAYLEVATPSFVSGLVALVTVYLGSNVGQKAVAAKAETAIA